MPQWNCACTNCYDARRGKIPPLTQSSVAICDDRGGWFLINASPDLPAQIRTFPDLQPKHGTLRNSPICGIFLTNADLDHVLGLFSLREGGRLHIYTTSAIREILDECLGLTTVMNAFCGVVWHDPPETDFAPLTGTGEVPGSLSYRAIRLPGRPPLFANGKHSEGVCSIAYCIMDHKSGGRLLVAPDVAGCNAALNEALQASDAVLFDGTFWSSDELLQIKANGRTAEEMGHVTVKDHSLALLRTLPASRKIYIHINNTNPILSPDSPEQTAVAAAGVEVGHDGLEFEL